MSFSQTSSLNPPGLEFHQVSKEKWKEFGDAMKHLDQSFQVLLRNMSESEKKSPKGDQVLVCQQAHAKVMSTLCEIGKQESVNSVPKVHIQAVSIKKEVDRETSINPRSIEQKHHAKGRVINGR